MKKSAFTMIELVLVIVVIGILAAVAIPRLSRDLRQEAMDNILSAIRYTQHMALMDDKTDPGENKWQQRFWRIYFGTCDGGRFYAIGTDIDTDGANNGRVEFTESAIDPANGKHMWAHDGGSCKGSRNINEISPNIFIGKKYGVKSVTTSGGCTNSYIGFDYLGRPYSAGFTTSATPDFSGIMTSDCTITFGFEGGGDDMKITIAKETGFAQIVDQNGS